VSGRVGLDACPHGLVTVAGVDSPLVGEEIDDAEPAPAIEAVTIDGSKDRLPVTIVGHFDQHRVLVDGHSDVDEGRGVANRVADEFSEDREGIVAPRAARVGEQGNDMPGSGDPVVRGCEPQREDDDVLVELDHRWPYPCSCRGNRTVTLRSSDLATDVLDHLIEEYRKVAAFRARAWTVCGPRSHRCVSRPRPHRGDAPDSALSVTDSAPMRRVRSLRTG